MARLEVALRFSPCLFSPASKSQEKYPEENRAAAVDSNRITQFVGSSGIIRCVDSDVITYHEIRQCSRHQRPVQNTSPKPGRAGRLV
ncbi:MAG: hypothetical protein JWQ71_3410 [Pedosphaera sp.]|nr:hypothetical protein [Pedosphaera sp.]